MLIDVDLGTGVMCQLDESLLTPNHSVINNGHERTVVKEFKLNGQVVHRSAHVTLKQGIGIEAVLGRF